MKKSQKVNVMFALGEEPMEVTCHDDNMTLLEVVNNARLQQGLEPCQPNSDIFLVKKFKEKPTKMFAAFATHREELRKKAGVETIDEDKLLGIERMVLDVVDDSSTFDAIRNKIPDILTLLCEYFDKRKEADELAAVGAYVNFVLAEGIAYKYEGVSREVLHDCVASSSNK
jgi:hypothetical protein